MILLTGIGKYNHLFLDIPDLLITFQNMLHTKKLHLLTDLVNKWSRYIGLYYFEIDTLFLPYLLDK